jgi:hypothetical protein
MELTLPPGQLAVWRERLAAFYGDVFGFRATDIDIFGQTAFALSTDAADSQFILVAENDKALQPAGYDHLGFLLDSREAVDRALAACRAWQQKDPAVEILEYDDLILPDTVTRAFYVRYGLPIWFDVQHIAYREGREPSHRWELVRRAV